MKKGSLKIRRKRHFTVNYKKVSPRKIDPTDVRYLYTKEFSENVLSFKDEERSQRNDLDGCNNLSAGGFHKAITPVLALFQFCGVMPIKGIKSADLSNVSFSWYSFHTIYSFYHVASLVVYLGTIVNWVITKSNKSPVGFILEMTVNRLFLLIASLIFIGITKKWPLLMKKWHKIEIDLPYKESADLLTKRVRWIFSVGLVITTFEYLLQFSVSIRISASCFANETDFVRNIYRIRFPYLYYVFDYSLILEIFCEIITLAWTLCWNNFYVFLLVIARGLSEFFKILNEKMIRVKGEQTTESFWMECRTLYQKICSLCEEVDKSISALTAVALVNLIFSVTHISFRVLTFRKITFTQFALFSTYLLFLIMRLLAISLYGARIMDEAKYPLKMLRSVPKESWCMETRRFYIEVYNNNAELTGMGYFSVNRSMALKILGLIINCDLVLYQYGKRNADFLQCEDL